MLRRNGPVIKSMESVLRPGRESIVGKTCVLSREWKREGVMDGESGELTEWEDVVGAWTGRAETEGLIWGWRRELGSWFQRQGEAYQKERSVIRSEDDVGGDNDTVGAFTFLISLSLRPNFRLRPNLIQKVKWRFWFGLSQLLSENFRWAFRWVRILDSVICSAKVNLNNSVLVQFTLPAVYSLIPEGLTIAERKLTSLSRLTLFVNKHLRWQLSQLVFCPQRLKKYFSRRCDSATSETAACAE